jgi:hypothetical protein
MEVPAVTGQITFMPEQPHPCGPPAGDWPDHTRWDCDDCAQRWIYLPSPMLSVGVVRDGRWWVRWDHDKPEGGPIPTADRIPRGWRKLFHIHIAETSQILNVWRCDQCRCGARRTRQAYTNLLGRVPTGWPVPEDRPGMLEDSGWRYLL